MNSIPLAMTVRHRQGVILTMVIIVGVILLVFGITLHKFVGQQKANVHMLAASEISHFLAEAGISSCIRSVRESLESSGLTDGSNSKVKEILSQPSPLADASLMPYLNDTWNDELAYFAKEVDPTAKIRVEIWLRDFKQTETDVKNWIDPGAKQGWLSIESSGEFRGMRRVLRVKRKVWVGNVLPPVTSKFTLHLQDAHRGNSGAYNIIKNDYASNVTDGPRPFVCINHSTPTSFFPFESKPISAISAEERNPEIYKDRGWVWLGGGQARLNITSGSGDYGEIFHFYDVSTSNAFKPIKFRTPQNKLPNLFASEMTLPWDLIDPNNPSSVQYFPYSFGHSFVLEGFHDKSTRRESDALYEKNILSRTAEKPKFGSKSSMLHLFGSAKLGFQSRTKVFGQVIAAFPRFATIEIDPKDPTIKDKFEKLSPPPIYLLPSLSSAEYRETFIISDFLNRKIGGPILGTGILFDRQEEYSKFMSCIVEMPYSTSYNTMQDAYEGISPRQFPPSRTILEEDLGKELVLTRDSMEIFKGNISALNSFPVIRSRIQREINSISEFWKIFYDEKKKELVLNEIVYIHNPDRETFLLPPQNIPYPLKVKGGGMIILGNGGLALRGVQLETPLEALTLVLESDSSVQFETPQVNQVNIFAPRANLTYGAKAEIVGTVALRSISPDSRTAGGAFRFRENQDPTKSGYYQFYKVRINDQDTFWHE